MKDETVDRRGIVTRNLFLLFVAVSWIPLISVFICQPAHGLSLGFLNKFTTIDWVDDLLKLNFYPNLRSSVDSSPGLQLCCLVSFLGGIGAGISLLEALIRACGPIEPLIAARAKAGKALSLGACATGTTITIIGLLWGLSGKASYVLPNGTGVSVALLAFASCPFIFILSLSGFVATVRVNNVERSLSR